MTQIKKIFADFRRFFARLVWHSVRASKPSLPIPPNNKRQGVIRNEAEWNEENEESATI